MMRSAVRSRPALQVSLKTNTMEVKSVAVITPAYNAQAFIGNAIKCVDRIRRASPGINIVHFIVDDCSTDNTVQEVKLFINSVANINLMQLESNMGQSYARNHALNKVFEQGYDYIAFLDADDLWIDDDHLAHAIAILESVDGHLVYSKPEFKDKDGNEVFPHGIPFEQEPTFENIQRVNSIYISSVVMKAWAAKVIGLFDGELDCVEDWDYWTRFLKAGYKAFRLYRLNQNCSVRYVWNPDGMAGKVTAAKMEKLRAKHAGDKIRLNLGCGDERIPGFLNCDLYEEKADMRFDAKALPFPDNTVDEIRAYHLIEHFTFQTAFVVLKEWLRALKPGGILVMETPDFLNTCKKFVEVDEQTRIILYGHFFAWPDLSPGQVHYFLYTETQMRWTLDQCGFVNVQRLAPDSTYARSNPQWPDLYLKVMAQKPQ